jgi:peptide subunit release factor 1 (eRF1)
MFTDKDLRELMQYTAPDPVLSIYLNTDPTQGNADAYRLRLRNLLKEVSLADDLLAVERYIGSEYDWTGRGVALFSCAPQGFFRAYPLALPVRNLVYVSNRPAVRVLADLMDCYGGYGVVLVDKQGARLFYFNLGEMHEQEGVLGEEVRRSKHGTASSMPGARSGGGSSLRKTEEVVERNMKEIAAFALEFLESRHVRRLLIGGTDENVTKFRSLLPKSWQSLVMATFPMPMTASHGEVLQKVLEIGDQADGHRESRFIQNLLASAGKDDKKAVVGVEPTLQAASDGRVDTLVMTEGFKHPAFQCANCGRLTILPGHVCPHCGGKYYELADVRDSLIKVVMLGGGDVEVVSATPEFETAGSIGALLRF